MDPLAAAIIGSWRVDWRLISLVVAAVCLYSRGWHKLHRELPHRYTTERLVSFCAGLLTILVALESPLDAFAGFLLQVHMVQHLLLIMVAPPLIWFSQPAPPLLRGFPQRFLKEGLGPFLRWHALQRVGRAIGHPLTSWLLMTAAIVTWHMPRLYDLGLQSPDWHMAEHICFLSAALLFWRPVIETPRWMMVPYLLLADIVNTALSAWLVFSDHVLYSTYAAAPRLGGSTALSDQVTAGALMWVPGSVAYLIPAFIITMRLLGGEHEQPHALRPPLPRPSTQPFDLLRVPFIGAILRHRHFRRVLQAVLLVLAIAVMVDGFGGPQIAPLNLAGVLPWTYWRGFAVIALLAAGNLFCMVCPFMLVRDFARKFLPASHRWPAQLRTKWIAAALLAIYLFAYEKFSLWNSPWWTAWVVIGYFAAAIAIDGWFQGASFCKYVCPIGQFQFVNSFISPLEIKVRSAAVCDSCRTHDCIRGNATQRGCELQLFQPVKQGNFDCTFCLDCVQACPQQNVGVMLAAKRGTSKRLDIAVLAMVLVFGAFISAAVMTTGTGTLWMYPAAAMVILAALTPRVAFALIPLGCSMWAAHFFYHLAAGWNSLQPVLGRLFHLSVSMTHTMPGDWVRSPQLLLLDGGLLWALYLAWNNKSPRAMAFAIALYVFGVWILFQPMAMRGMLMT